MRRSSLPPRPHTPAAPVYAMEEVRRHASAHDVWVVLHGNVYDLTRVMRSLPCGAATLASCAGSDATDRCATHGNVHVGPYTAARALGGGVSSAQV